MNCVYKVISLPLLMVAQMVNAGDPSLIPGSGRSPGGGHGNQVQYSCLESPHRQRCLVGYRLWDHKEADTTAWLNTHELFKLLCIQGWMWLPRVTQQISHRNRLPALLMMGHPHTFPGPSFTPSLCLVSMFSPSYAS